MSANHFSARLEEVRRRIGGEFGSLVHCRIRSRLRLKDLKCHMPYAGSTAKPFGQVGFSRAGHP